MSSISIIIPCFNQQKYLQDAINSIFRQKLDDYEIIIVDDGSMEIEQNIYSELSANPNIFIYQQNHQGAGAARNFGVKKAKKDFLAFLDADDIWFEHKIKWQLEILKQDKADMVFGYVEQFVSPEYITTELVDFPIKNRIMEGICPSSLLMRREQFLKVGLFHSQLKLGEFIAWYLKAKKYGLISYTVEKVLVGRRIHKNNTSYLNQKHRLDYLKLIHHHLQGDVI